MIMMFWLAIISLISLCHGARKCADFDAMETFTTIKLLGTWWEYQSFQASEQILGGGKSDDCLTIKIYPRTFTDMLGITEDYVKPGNDNEEHVRTLWLLHTIDETATNAYFYSGGKTGELWTSYIVVDTDYKSYIIFANCIPKLNLESVSIFTSSQNPTDAEKEEIEKKLAEVYSKNEKANSKRNLYVTKDNTKCKPVEFPEIFKPPRVF